MKQHNLELTLSKDGLPLTFAERQIIIEQNLATDSCANNINIPLEIKGKLDIPLLEQSLTELVNRHTAFRSYYTMENGEFRHRIMEKLQVSLLQHSCNLDEVDSLIKTLDTPYNLSNAPLFRFNLFNVDAEHSILHLAFHHIIMDATSAAVMFDELWRLYRGEKLSPVKFDYPDYAVLQSQNLDEDAGKEFFTQMFFDGIPMPILNRPEMPILFRRPDVLPIADVNCECIIDAVPIDEAAKRFGVSTFKLLFSAVGLTLAKYCGSEEVVVGCAMNGRPTAQSFGIIGMFVNILPILIKVHPEVQVSEYIKNVSQLISETKKHQTYPFEKIVSMFAPDRDASRYPLFDIVVNYLTEIPIPDVSGLSIRMIPNKRQALGIDLKLEMQRVDDKLLLILSYSRELYQDEIISNMMEQLTTIISRLVALHHCHS